MGHSCYTCLKILKWNMRKMTFDEITVDTWGGMKRVPPEGFTSKDRLCYDCADRLQTRKSFKKEKTTKADNDIKYNVDGTTVDDARTIPKTKYETLSPVSPSSLSRLPASPKGYVPPSVISSPNEDQGGVELNTQLRNIAENIERLKLKDKGFTENWRVILKNKYKSDWLGNSENTSEFNLQASEKMKELETKQDENNFEINILENKRKYIESSLHQYYASKKLNRKSKIKEITKIENPLDILKMRLVKGEITIDEFNRIKENLE